MSGQDKQVLKDDRKPRKSVVARGQAKRIRRISDMPGRRVHLLKEGGATMKFLPSGQC